PATRRHRELSEGVAVRIQDIKSVQAHQDGFRNAVAVEIENRTRIKGLLVARRIPFSRYRGGNGFVEYRGMDKAGEVIMHIPAPEDPGLTIAVHILQGDAVRYG